MFFLCFTKKVATIPQAGETKRRRWGDPRGVDEQPHSALEPGSLQVAVTPPVLGGSGEGVGGLGVGEGASWSWDTVPFEAGVD